MWPRTRIRPAQRLPQQSELAQSIDSPVELDAGNAEHVADALEYELACESLPPSQTHARFLRMNDSCLNDSSP